MAKVALIIGPQPQTHKQQRSIAINRVSDIKITLGILVMQQQKERIVITQDLQAMTVISHKIPEKMLQQPAITRALHRPKQTIFAMNAVRVLALPRHFVDTSARSIQTRDINATIARRNSLVENLFNDTFKEGIGEENSRRQDGSASY